MRTLIFTAITIIAIIVSSCSKDEIDDFTISENLSGTTWKSTSGTDWDEDLEYALLVFTSTTSVEGRTKQKNEEELKDWKGSFSVTKNIISIFFEDESFTGVIEGQTMNMTIDEETFIFSKQ